MEINVSSSHPYSLTLINVHISLHLTISLIGQSPHGFWWCSASWFQCILSAAGEHSCRLFKCGWTVGMSAYKDYQRCHVNNRWNILRPPSFGQRWVPERFMQWSSVSRDALECRGEYELWSHQLSRNCVSTPREMRVFHSQTVWA